MKVCDGNAITIVSHEENLYKVNFTKVYIVDVANLVQFLMGDGVFGVWHRCLSHLNMKDVHTLQNMVSAMNLGKKKGISHSRCFTKHTLKVNNIGWHF